MNFHCAPSRCFLPLFAALAISSCTRQQTPDGPIPPPDDLECAVLSEALDSLLVHSGAPRSAQVMLYESTHVEPVADSLITRTYPLDEYLDETGPLAWVQNELRLSPSTIASFRAHNRQPTHTCERLTTHWSVLVLPDTTAHALGRAKPRDSWGRFADSSAFIWTSRVGISTDTAEAVLTCGYWCGDLCAAGFVVVLHRDTAGLWVERSHITAWIE